tara:strand:- start:14028 stop:15101 length:1074 start_codon:yes stop_codon:yes gene_type:complete
MFNLINNNKGRKMKTLKKLAFSILASAFVFANANAGELAVSGSAKATYTIISVDGSPTKQSAGKGMGMANEFSLTASGELDNGYTWAMNIDIDGDTTQDDGSLTFGMGGLGSLKWNISDGGITKDFASMQSVYGASVDNGNSGSVAATGGYTDSGDTGAMNTIRYTTPSGLPLDLSASIQFAPSTGANSAASSNAAGTVDAGAEDAIEYAFSMVPVEGLEIGASYYDPDDPSAAQAEEGGAYYATYAIGSLSFGLGKSFKATSLATNTTNEAEAYENTMMSVAFNVNDALSISYEDIESSKEFETSSSDVDMDVTSMQAAYTVAGATFSISNEEYDNFQYTTGNKLKETNFAMSIAF